MHGNTACSHARESARPAPLGERGRDGRGGRRERDDERRGRRRRRACVAVQGAVERLLVREGERAEVLVDHVDPQRAGGGGGRAAANDGDGVIESGGAGCECARGDVGVGEGGERREFLKRGAAALDSAGEASLVCVAREGVTGGRSAAVRDCSN